MARSQSNGLTVDDFYDWILAGCGPVFFQLSHDNPVFSSNPTLDDYGTVLLRHDLALRVKRIQRRINLLSCLRQPDGPAKRSFSGVHYLD